MTGAEREKYIWSRLTAAGLTPAGAAGLMGNLYAESGLNPANLQNTHEKKLGLTDAAYTAAVDAGTYTNFAGDGAGYGLAQWTYKTRKAALLAPTPSCSSLSGPPTRARPPGPAAPGTGKPTLTDTLRRTPPASCPPACLWTSSSPWRGISKPFISWGALGPL